MKVFVASLAGMLVGSAIGWMLGTSRATALSSRATAELVSRRVEPELAGGADYAITIIPMIERGDTNAAIERLCRMIAVYYHNYAREPGTNEYRLRGRAVIDEMARTNPIVARMLKEVARGE